MCACVCVRVFCVCVCENAHLNVFVCFVKLCNCCYSCECYLESYGSRMLVYIIVCICMFVYVSECLHICSLLVACICFRVFVNCELNSCICECLFACLCICSCRNFFAFCFCLFHILPTMLSTCPSLSLVLQLLSRIL